MTHEAIQIITACLNIAAGCISVTALVISTRANRRCQKALKDIQDAQVGLLQEYPSVKTH